MPELRQVIIDRAKADGLILVGEIQDELIFEPDPTDFNPHDIRRMLANVDPMRGRLYIVRHTTYGFPRVYNLRTMSWVGNAFEHESTAKALADRLEASNG